MLYFTKNNKFNLLKNTKKWRRPKVHQLSTRVELKVGIGKRVRAGIHAGRSKARAINSAVCVINFYFL